MENIPTNLSDGSQGIEALAVYLSQEVPFLVPGILIFVFFIIMGAGYFAQDRKTGRGNLPMWAAISALITTTGSFVLFMIEGLVNLEVIIIAVMVCIMSAMWFLLSANRD